MRVRAMVPTTVLLVLGLLLGHAAAASAESSYQPSSARRGIGIVTSSAPYVMPIEPYAGYQPQTKCRQKPKAGILLLADWLVARGGGYGPISRSCEGTSTSEHKESRAFDWLLDASNPEDAALAQAMLDEIFAPDDTGEPAALARRMGVMYVIWNDRMYAAYRGFAPERYLSSSCRTKKSCSPTLRHRDHVHISLTRQGAKGLTSWYYAQQPPPAG